MLIILLGHLWIVELTHIYIFAFKFTLRYLQPDINPIAAGVVDTGGTLPPELLTPAANLLPVLLTPVANLPPVSTTLVKLVAKFVAGVVDTGGKTTQVANLPPVSLIPVVNLELRISPQIFDKNSKRPKWYTQGLGGN